MAAMRFPAATGAAIADGRTGSGRVSISNSATNQSAKTPAVASTPKPAIDVEWPEAR